MKVMVTTAYEEPGPLQRLIEMSGRDRFRVHERTDDPEEADIIFFAESSCYRTDPFYRTLLSHEFVSRFPEKVFMYNEQDNPWYVLPGLYTSMLRRHYDSSRIRPCCYLVTLNPYIEEAAEAIDPDLLFSFCGWPRKRVRKEILTLQHPRAILKSSEDFNAFNRDARSNETGLRRYAEIMARSRFVLCPRGSGTGTFRLFETLKAGRVPVILSDEWVPPTGPPWDEFALFVRERDVRGLPAMLEQAESRWEEMAARAREAWEHHFADEVLFHNMVEACGEILASRRVPEAWRRRLPSAVKLERMTRWYGSRIKQRARALVSGA
jgi:hypothetical protein